MNDRQLAYVLLDRSVTLDMAALTEMLRQRHPDLPIELLKDSARPDHIDANSPIVRCGSELVVIMAVPAPLPRDEEDGIWVRASLTWPDAPAVQRRHRAHFIVSTIGTQENQLPLARVLTAVIGGLISITPECSAVVWGNRVVRSADNWRDMSRAAFAPYPNYPFLLWIDIFPLRSSSAMNAVTVGLLSFVGREIEFEAGSYDPSSVLNRTAGLSAYLIEHGAVLRDGDTFGVSERERLKIQYANSVSLGGLPVFRTTPMPL